MSVDKPVLALLEKQLPVPVLQFDDNNAVMRHEHEHEHEVVLTATTGQLEGRVATRLLCKRLGAEGALNLLMRTHLRLRNASLLYRNNFQDVLSFTQDLLRRCSCAAPAPQASLTSKAPDFARVKAT